MTSRFILAVAAASLVAAISIPTRAQQPAAAPAIQVPFEQSPVLAAAAILQPQYLQGQRFTVRDTVPTYAGSNRYTIDSDFGIFEANGNAMLLRRVAEIHGIAKLREMSQTKEFTDAAKDAAVAPLHFAQDLVSEPVQTVSNVPRGVWGFLQGVGQSVESAVQGSRPTQAEGGVVANVSGFAKTKRGIAISLGVDPYCNNEVFQKELNKVAWPAFLGKFTVNIGLGAISGGAGTVFSAINLTGTMLDTLRDKSAPELRSMNEGILVNNMGVSPGDASAFVNNNAISPTTQTAIVAALGQLGNIPGQADFIRQATTSSDEHTALAFQQSVQIMANLNQTAPIARITHLSGLPVCQTNDGTVIIPLQWDYAAWTPTFDSFITAIKAAKFHTPATGYTLMITGVASPKATEALAGLGVNLKTKVLPGPLR